MTERERDCNGTALVLAFNHTKEEMTTSLISMGVKLNEMHWFSGVMGVPITFMDKYNPDQFLIIGADEAEGTGFSNGVFLGGKKQCLVNGQRIYKRIFIRAKHDDIQEYETE